MSEILASKRGVCFFNLRFKKRLHEGIPRLLIVIPFLSCILCYLHTLKKRLLNLARNGINRLTRNQFGWGKCLKGSVRGVGNGVDPSTSCLVGNRLTRNQFGWGKGLKGSVRVVGNGVDPSNIMFGRQVPDAAVGDGGLPTLFG